MAEVHRKAFKLGLTCSINNFHSLVLNRIYCVNIRVREIDGEEELKLFRIAKRDQPKFLQDITSAYNQVRNTASSMRQGCIDELHILDDQIINARELLLVGKIEPSDFKILKMDYDNKLSAINLRLTALKERFKDKVNIQPMVINAIETLRTLPRLYETATIEDKRYLVETIFNGMLIFNKDGYRTTNLNPIKEITYLINKELQGYKKGEKYL